MRAGLAVASASALLSIGTTAQAHSPTGSPARAVTNVTLPTPASARSIVTNLWSRREVALATLSAARLAPIERASAKQSDTAYVANVLCKCEPQKDRHPASAVVVQVPKRTVKPVFFAQVRTTNAKQEHPWYLVAVERDRGAWKLALIAFGGYGTAPPLQKLTKSNATTPPLNAGAYTRITHIADASLAYGKAHTKHVDHTSYGATIRIRSEIHPTKDGIYGLAIPGGKVFSCFTMHSIETYSLPGGLSQGSARTQWGYPLAPGTYKTITVDNAAPMCTLGKGIGNDTGVLRFTYQQRVIGTTGVRM